MPTKKIEIPIPPKGMHYYKVKMTCGHIEQRLMRPSTAGVAFDSSAEFQVWAPYAKCVACSKPGER